MAFDYDDSGVSLGGFDYDESGRMAPSSSAPKIDLIKQKPQIVEALRLQGLDGDDAEFEYQRMAKTGEIDASTLGGMDAAQQRIAKRGSTFSETVGNMAVKGAQGVVGLGESAVGIADLATLNLPGKGLAAIGYDPARTKEMLGEGLSDGYRAQEEIVRGAKGFGNTVSALLENPAMIGGGIAESAPLMLGGMAAARAAAQKMLAAEGFAIGSKDAATFLSSPQVVAKLTAIASGAEGAMTAGSIQEQGRQGGRDWSQTVLPAVAAGAGTAAIGVLSSKIPGFRDADVSAATAGLGAAERTTLLQAGKEIAKGTFKEGFLEEMPQSAQEQVFTNLAMGKPWQEGVQEAAATGLVVGAAQGGGMIGYSSLRNADLPAAFESEQSALGRQLSNLVDGSEFTPLQGPGRGDGVDEAMRSIAANPWNRQPTPATILAQPDVDSAIAAAQSVTAAPVSQDALLAELDSGLNLATLEPELLEPSNDAAPLDAPSNLGTGIDGSGSAGNPSVVPGIEAGRGGDAAAPLPDSGTVAPVGVASATLGDVASLRPQTIAGKPAESYTDEQLQETAKSHLIHMDTRKAATLELQARQEEQSAKTVKPSPVIAEITSMNQAPIKKEDDWLGALFGDAPNAEDSAKKEARSAQQAQDKADRADAAIAMLTGEIKASNAAAAEVAARNYKSNRKQVELKGDGPGKNGSLSITAINESRKRRTVEALQNASSSIKQAISFIAENPDAAFKQVADMEAAVTKQFKEGFFGPSAKLDVQLDMAVGSLIGSGSYSGDGSAGRKLRMAAHAYATVDAEPSKNQLGEVTDMVPVADTVSQPKTGTSTVRGNTTGTAARDDLVGAIMRVTGNKGISPAIAPDTTGDKAGAGNPKLRGLFINGGTEDLGAIAELLRVEEGFDVRDGEHLSELIRNAAAGDVATSMGRTESDASAEEESRRKDYYLKRANELGLKGIGGKRKLEHVVAQVDAKEAEIAAKEKEIGELEAREERAAIQTADIAEDIYQEGSQLTEADLIKWLGERIEYTQDDIDEANTRALERESRRAEADAGYDSETQAQSSSAEGAGAGQTKSRARGTTEEGFDLAAQTNTQAAAEFKRQQEEAAKKEEAPAAPTVKADQVDLFNTQGGLFNSNRDGAPQIKFSKSGDFEKVADAWIALSKNDEIFSYPTSKSAELSEIAETVAPDMLFNELSADTDVAKAWEIFVGGEVKTIPDAFIFQYRDGRVEVNVSRVGEGNQGSRVYAIAGNYAYNNGLVFAGDRMGITPKGIERRLENMLSLALKFGSTDFLLPHPDMKLDWKKGDFKHNMKSMLERSYENALKSNHWIADYDYDFNTGTFRDSAGNAVALTDAGENDFQEGVRFAAEAGSRGDNSGRVRVDQDRYRTEKRNIFTHSLLRRTGEEGWGKLLERIGAMSSSGLEEDYKRLAYSFAGQSAATADTHALATAQQRLNAGDDAETVRKETGWFIGADGNPRFEIDDSGASLKAEGRTFGDVFNAINRNGPVVLSDVIDHPALFAAYPDLASLRVRLIPFSEQGLAIARYVSNGNPMFGGTRIEVEKTEDSATALSALLHEIQHGVQTIEDFATGGNQETVETYPEKTMYQARLLRARMESSGESSKEAIAWYEAKIKSPIDSVSVYLANAHNGYELSRMPQGKQDGYKRLYGEVEARNVQSRQALSAEQRRNQPPESTQDVANSDVIIVFNGKEMASAPTPANAVGYVAPITEQQATTAIANILGKAGNLLIDAGQIVLVRTEAGLKNLPGARYMTAWHGSPHDHDGFDNGYRGTGEGASGFGAGMHFTAKKSDASEYKRKLQKARGEGRIYKVDIPEGNEYLDLSKYIDQQSEFVTDALHKLDGMKVLLPVSFGKIDFTLPVDFFDQHKYTNGMTLFRSLEQLIPVEYEDSEYGASYVLKQVGLAGNRHSEFGNDHFIVFNDEDITITAKYSRQNDLQSNNGLPNKSPINRTIDAAELVALRGAASRLERPQDGVFLRVTEDGRAIATGPKGTRIPDAFVRFAKDHDLAFEARRNGEGRKSNDVTVGKHITSKTEPMPPAYREAGALYFGEGNVYFDRTGKTRFAKGDGAIQGATLPDGRIALVLENLTQDNIAGVFKHEGFHASIKQLLGEKTYQQLMDRLGQIAKLNKSWAAEAEKSIPADTDPKNWLEEIGAYAIEQGERGAKLPGSIRQWVADFLSAIRSAIISSKHMPDKMKLYAMKHLKPADLSRMAVAGLRAKAKQIVQSQGREAMAFSQASIAAEHQEVERNIEGKSVIEAAEWIAENAPSADYRLIAASVAEKLKAFERVGGTLNLFVAHGGDAVPATLRYANAAVITMPKSQRIEVWINGADLDGKVGVTYETVLHELVHAATTLSLIDGYAKYSPGASKAVSDLASVTEAIKAHFTERMEAYENGEGGFSKFERHTFTHRNNALADDHEIVAWAMTSRDMQEYLEGIPYQSSSLWTAFVDAVRIALGLSPQANTALSEVLRVGKALIDESPLLYSYGDSKMARAGFTQHVIMAGDTVTSGGGFNRRKNGIERSGKTEAVQARDIERDQEAGADSETMGLKLSRAQQPLPGTTVTPPAPPFQSTLGVNGTSGNSAAWDAPEPSKLDNIVYEIQNKHVDLKRVTAAIKETIGNLQESYDAEQAEKLYHARRAERVKDFLEHEEKPMIEDMRMRGVSIPELEAYLWARTAKETNAYIATINDQMPDGGSGLTNQEADDYFAGVDVKDANGDVRVPGMDAAKQVRLEALARRIDSIVDGNRRLMVAYQLEAQSTVDTWQQTYPNYVPLQRDGMETPMAGPGIGQGFSVKGQETKRRTGSNKNVVDILGNLMEQRAKIITRGEKNRVAQAAYGLAKTNPNTDFWSTDKPEVQKIVQRVGGQDKVVSRVDPMWKARPNALVAKFVVNGKVEERAVVFNVRNERALRMAEAMKNLDADQLGHVLGLMAKGTRYFASVNTQFNPIFGTINFLRDVQTGMLNLSSTPLKGHKAEIIGNLWGAMRGTISAMRGNTSGQWAQLYNEFRLQGGVTGFTDMFSGGAEHAESLQKMLDPTKWDKVEKAVFENKLGKFLSAYNTVLETAVRLATYKAGIDNGLSKAQAARVGKELTVNFNQKGRMATQIGAGYAFFNAAMQGMARMKETMWQDGKPTKAGIQIMTGGVMIGVAQALALAAAGFDDDDDPKEFVRERNIIIPIGDKKFITIPMPLGFHAIPNIGRVTTEWMLNGFKNPTEATLKLANVFVDSFNPLGSSTALQTITPTVIDPIAGIAENKDWSGKNIAKLDRSSLAPTPGYLRSKDTATPWAKAISYAFNIASGGTDYKKGALSPTPDQIDYLIGQATGGVGREVSKLAQTVESAFTGEELPPHKIPLAGRFYGNATGQSAESSKFYSAITRINEHEAELKGLRKEGKTDEAMEYLKENREAMLVQAANQMELEITKLRTAKRDALKAKQKDRVKLIEQKMTSRMRSFNERVKKMEAVDP